MSLQKPAIHWSVEHEAVVTIMARSACILFLLLWTINPLFCQSPNLRFDRLTVKQGLSNSVVHASLKDNHGFMWLATSNGLNRFDGVDFKIFKHKTGDPNSLSQNHIKCLWQDSRGYLWVGTQVGGLNRYDYQTGKFSHFRHDPDNAASISNDEILCIYEDSQNRLWIGTEQGLNLFDYEKETFQSWKHNTTDPQSLGAAAVLRILEDRHHRLWIGTWNGGLNQMKAGQYDGQYEFERFVPNTTDPNARHVWSLYEDQSVRIWLGTLGGLFLMDYPPDSKTAPVFYRFRHNPEKSNSICNDLVFDIEEDREGQIWLATAHGLSTFNPQQLNVFKPGTNISEIISFTNHHYSYSDEWSLVHDEIRDLYKDEEDMIWCSTFGGVSKYNPDLKKFESHIPPFSNNKVIMIQAIAEGDAGIHWIGTGGEGLLKYEPSKGRYRQYLHEEENPQSLLSNAINAFHLEKDTLWIAGERGLSLLDLKTEQFLNFPLGPLLQTRNKANTIFKDSRGLIWLGTERGLVLVDRNNLGIKQRYTHQADQPNTISNDNVISINEDRDGHLWVATLGGLNRLLMEEGKPIRFEHFLNDPTDPQSICSNRIISISVLEDELWLGTEDGLSNYKMAEQRFYNYTDAMTVPDLYITALLPDNKSHLWGSTRDGLFSFDLKHKTFNAYTMEEGLHGSAFSYNSFWKAADGKFYFGGRRGYTSFYPDSIYNNTQLPPIVLTGFRKFNEEIRFEKDLTELEEIHLSYKENYITFEFAALNFNRADKNQYAYMLEGFDKDWMYCGNRKSATYTNLDGCDYTFRVKGSNNDNAWNEKGTSIRLIVHPPFWETIWFKLLALLGIGLLTGTIIWMRMRRMIEKTERLEAYNSSLNTEILERKKIEQTLSQREQLLQLIIDNIPQYIYWKDKRSAYVGCNQNFARVAGYQSPEDIVGKKDYELNWQKQLADHYKQTDDRVMKSGKDALDVVYSQRQKNGRQTWIKANKIPLYHPNGAVIGMLGTFADITERKDASEALKRYSEKLEEMVAKRTEMIGEQKEQIELLLIQLRKKNESLEATVKERTLKLQASNEELTRSNHDLEQFAYIASHDLQEPLRMIGNFVQLLERKYGEEVGKEGRSYIQFAVEGVTRMSNLIQSLLNYSRIGREGSKLLKTDINHIVHQKVMDLSKRVEDQEAIIEMQHLSKEVVCEPNQMGILFYNLIGNALKFNKNERPRVLIRQKDSGRHWTFSVSDNGIGINPRYQDRIFQIFKRLNRREEFEGNGIGLSICKRIVDEHKGKIWFDSKPGQGTTFYFTIDKRLSREN